MSFTAFPPFSYDFSQKFNLREALNKSTRADCRQIFSLARRFFAGILCVFQEKGKEARGQIWR
jgi:hypothetical protein